MSDISFEEILTLARQESASLHHYFIGVEHLFIALTKVSGGLTAAVLDRHGLSGRFVRYSIRETVGRYEDRRFWPGFPETPRAARVLAQASHYEAQGYSPERALLLAILEENDNVVVRVLRGMGMEAGVLARAVAEWDIPLEARVPEVPIRGPVTLDTGRERVLQMMFREYAAIDVLRELDGGYSTAQVLLVHPERIGGGKDAPVVVKLDDRDHILYERLRYDQYVHRRLPLGAARLIDAPATPDDTPYGGLKYQFVGDLDTTKPVNLREVAVQDAGYDLNVLIRQLFDQFGAGWWKERQPYRFGAWREYEHVLPPALVADWLPETAFGATGHVIAPLGNWSRSDHILPGEIVRLNRFFVRKTDVERDALYLVAGAKPEAINRSGEVEVRGMNLVHRRFLRGQEVEALVGRVVSTRYDLLLRHLQELDPGFDLRLDELPSGRTTMPTLPNPLQHFYELLQRQINGNLSTIHGDMHMANVLVGPQGNPWLIDFALVRDGHTLFDWALLELSLLVHVAANLVPSDWESQWGVVERLHAINRGEESALHAEPPVTRVLAAVKTIREVVRECLYDPALWNEYYIPLALIGLRAMGWRTEGIGSRRLAFLVSALALHEVRGSEGVGSTDGMDMAATDREFSAYIDPTGPMHKASGQETSPEPDADRVDDESDDGL